MISIKIDLGRDKLADRLLAFQLTVAFEIIFFCPPVSVIFPQDSSFFGGGGGGEKNYQVKPLVVGFVMLIVALLLSYQLTTYWFAAIHPYGHVTRGNFSCHLQRNDDE